MNMDTCGLPRLTVIENWADASTQTKILANGLRARGLGVLNKDASVSITVTINLRDGTSGARTLGPFTISAGSGSFEEIFSEDFDSFTITCPAAQTWEAYALG